jgi:beta-1,2-xylosyltransferase
MQSYMFLLYLEYARLVSPDRDNGNMVGRLAPFHFVPLSSIISNSPHPLLFAVNPS